MDRHALFYDLVEWTFVFTGFTLKYLITGFSQNFIQAIAGYPFGCLGEKYDAFVHVDGEDTAFHVLQKPFYERSHDRYIESDGFLFCVC